MFLSDHEGSIAIYTMQADGTDIQPFADNNFEEGGEITGASLSPDGSTLAVSSRKERSLDYFADEIFLLDIATGTTTMLTNDSRNNTAPIWSPDSQQLAYLTGSGINGYNTVHVADIASQNIRVVATESSLAPVVSDDFGAVIRGLDWSPDGNQLVLAVQTGLPDVFSTLVVVNSDGTSAEQVTSNQAIVGPNISWGDDLNLIYTACRINNYGEICRLNLQTLQIDQLSDLSIVFPDERNPYVSSLDVSPLGGIIFTYGVTNHDVYEFNVANASVTLISSVTGDKYQLLGWVNTPSDNSTCDTTISQSHTTTLISAINTGNNADTPYTICLEDSTYTLNQNALPTITGDITIIGNSATITHDTSASDVHIFRVADGASLTLENLTLNGRDPIDNAGTVRLQAVTLEGDSGNE